MKNHLLSYLSNICRIFRSLNALTLDWCANCFIIQTKIRLFEHESDHSLIAASSSMSPWEKSIPVFLAIAAMNDSNFFCPFKFLPLSTANAHDRGWQWRQCNSSSDGQKSGIPDFPISIPSRCLIKKIRPLLYSKYPPSSSKSGLIFEVGHREGC